MSEVNQGIRVFVYGSLKEGFGNHCVLADAEKLGPSTITGQYKLLDLGWYPGVVRSTDEMPPAVIHGEVYKVDEDGLDALDCLEGHPSYYCRIKVPTPEYKNAWVYFLPASYDDGKRPHVADGVWKQPE